MQPGVESPRYTFVYFGAECYGKTSDGGKVVPETTWTCQFLNQHLAVYDGNTFTHETTRNQIVISQLKHRCLDQMHYLDKHKFISFRTNPFFCNPLRRNDTAFFGKISGSDTISRYVPSSTLLKRCKLKPSTSSLAMLIVKPIFRNIEHALANLIAHRKGAPTSQNVKTLVRRLNPAIHEKERNKIKVMFHSQIVLWHVHIPGRPFRTKRWKCATCSFLGSTQYMAFAHESRQTNLPLHFWEKKCVCFCLLCRAPSR